ncbi:iron chaperone [Agromyces silvae]|uniref:iron chaperone n=1 Tax=Agromyces silvae TaxID=3388266 RepID=UPI00280B5D32|nr:DUF1801 domain-containing protein [Agromyces protaetiae]
MAATPKYASVDEYLESFPPERREVLESVRAAIHRGVPNGEERIRYDMPAVMLGGRYAIHFAGWKQHLGLYPVPRFDGPFEAEVEPHRTKTDTLSFPWSRPVPYDLIERISAAIVALRA